MSKSITVESMLNKMLRAAKASVAQDWPKVADEATHQLQFMAQSIAAITSLAANGELTPEQARLDLDIAKNTAQINLITNAGLSKLMAQHTLDDALEAVKDTIDDVIGFDLL
jgi:hypothetical protein